MDNSPDVLIFIGREVGATLENGPERDRSIIASYPSGYNPSTGMGVSGIATSG